MYEEAEVYEGDYMRQVTKEIPHDYLTVPDYIDSPIPVEDIYLTKKPKHVKSKSCLHCLAIYSTASYKK